LLLALAPEAVHVATGTLVVTMGGGQVVLTNELPSTGSAGVQEAEGTLVVTTGVGHVMVT